jgi:hypothetical protein
LFPRPDPQRLKHLHRFARGGGGRFLNVALLFLLVFSTSSAVASGWILFGPDLSSPRIELEPAAVDFGTVTAGDEVTVHFTVRNRGWSTLKLSSISASCTCSVAEIQSNEISPGGSAAMTLKINTEGSSGMVRSAVAVQTNDPKRRSVTFVASGNILKRKPNSQVPHDTATRRGASSRSSSHEQ